MTTTQTLKETLKVNDILVEQFGYNMTLYSFYKVVEIKGCTVKLQPMAKKSGGWIGFMTCEVQPIDEPRQYRNEILTKRFNKYGRIAIDNNNLYLYDKNRMYIEQHND